MANQKFATYFLPSFPPPDSSIRGQAPAGIQSFLLSLTVLSLPKETMNRLGPYKIAAERHPGTKKPGCPGFFYRLNPINPAI